MMALVQTVLIILLR